MSLREIILPKPIKAEETIDPLIAQYREAIQRVIFDLETKGLLGKHLLQTAPALQTTGESGLVGMLQGNLLFGISGRFYGEQNTGPALTFAWTTNTEEPILVFTAVPADKLIIRKVEQAPPTISFRFNLPHFVRLNSWLSLGLSNYAFSTIEGSHPNDYLKPEAIRQAIVEVDETAFGQLQSLEFGRAFLQAPKKEQT